MEYKKRRTALYIRVSTSEQKKHWYWLVSQKDSLTKHMLSIEEYWFYYDEMSIYIDAWLCWWLEEKHRPELQRMMNDIKIWKIQAVLVWKIDRIARSTIILLDLVDKFKEYWVEFISKSEQIDTSSPNWIFFLTILLYSIHSNATSLGITSLLTKDFISFKIGSLLLTYLPYASSCFP